MDSSGQISSINSASDHYPPDYEISGWTSVPGLHLSYNLHNVPVIPTLIDLLLVSLILPYFCS